MMFSVYSGARWFLPMMMILNSTVFLPHPSFPVNLKLQLYDITGIDTISPHAPSNCKFVNIEKNQSNQLNFYHIYFYYFDMFDIIIVIGKLISFWDLIYQFRETIFWCNGRDLLAKRCLLDYLLQDHGTTRYFYWTCKRWSG